VKSKSIKELQIRVAQEPECRSSVRPESYDFRKKEWSRSLFF